LKYYELITARHFFLVIKKFLCFLQELIEYHSYNAGGLACRLKNPPGRSKPPTAGLSHGKWEIDPTELTLLEELGSGKGAVTNDVTDLGERMGWQICDSGICF
jgi:tyrosine-protein kinase Tec